MRVYRAWISSPIFVENTLNKTRRSISVFFKKKKKKDELYICIYSVYISCVYKISYLKYIPTVWTVLYCAEYFRCTFYANFEQFYPGFYARSWTHPKLMIQFKRGGQRKTCRITRACSMLNRIRRLEIYRIHLPRRRAINSNKPPPSSHSSWNRITPLYTPCTLIIHINTLTRSTRYLFLINLNTIHCCQLVVLGNP